MDRNIGDEILEALKEVESHVKGESTLRTESYALDPGDIKALRANLGMTQEQFALLFGISVHTLRCWEQGRRTPEGPARALLRVVEREPEAVLRALHGSGAQEDGKIR